jgi:ElaB/YqjD/DUF883 family membrane-anchored ribosome-binding protein
MEFIMDQKENAQSQLTELEDRLKEIKDRTSEFVKEHPLTSIAIAAGVGYIIAKLLSGRRS